MVGSSIVAGIAQSLLLAILRIVPRRIFPERVFGNRWTDIIIFKAAKAPIFDLMS